MKILQSFWFTNANGSFGIVVGEDDITKKRKAYIGTCGNGLSEAEDTILIAHTGAKLHVEQLKNIINLLNPTED